MNTTQDPRIEQSKEYQPYAYLGSKKGKKS